MGPRLTQRGPLVYYAMGGIQVRPENSLYIPAHNAGLRRSNGVRGPGCSRQRDSRMMRRGILGITNAWPPMIAGHGNFFHDLVGCSASVEVLVPRAARPESVSCRAHRWFIVPPRIGGPLRVYSVLQPLETTVTPLFWLLVRWYKPRLIVASQVLFSGLSALLCSRVFGIPFLVIAHGEEVGAYLKAPRRLNAKLAQAVLESARVVVCNSRNTEDLVKRFCRPGRPATRVILPCVNPHQAGANAAEVAELRRDLRATGPLVLSVGRLEERRKGFDIAIKALKTVREAVPGAILAIVGPGDQSRLKNLAREEGVAESVRFLGPVSRSALSGLYSLCDVFLLPVRSLPDGNQEGFGIVFLEAGLHAKPVVAGRSGGS